MLATHLTGAASASDWYWRSAAVAWRRRWTLQQVVAIRHVARGGETRDAASERRRRRARVDPFGRRWAGTALAAKIRWNEASRNEGARCAPTRHSSVGWIGGERRRKTRRDPRDVKIRRFARERQHADSGTRHTRVTRPSTSAAFIVALRCAAAAASRDKKKKKKKEKKKDKKKERNKKTKDEKTSRKIKCRPPPRRTKARPANRSADGTQVARGVEKSGGEGRERCEEKNPKIDRFVISR